MSIFGEPLADRAYPIEAVADVPAACGRRPRSAKARNRGRWAAAVQRTLWGFGRGVKTAN